MMASAAGLLPETSRAITFRPSSLFLTIPIRVEIVLSRAKPLTFSPSEYERKSSFKAARSSLPVRRGVASRSVIQRAGRIGAPPISWLRGKSSVEISSLVPLTKIIPAAPFSFARLAFTRRGAEPRSSGRDAGTPRSTTIQRFFGSIPAKLS